MGLRWSWNDGWLLNLDDVLETDLASSRHDYVACKDGSKPFPRKRLDNEPGCGDGSDEERANHASSCGVAIKESRRNLNEGVDQSTILDTDDGSEAIPHQQDKKSGEGVVSILKDHRHNSDSSLSLEVKFPRQGCFHEMTATTSTPERRYFGSIMQDSVSANQFQTQGQWKNLKNGKLFKKWKFKIHNYRALCTQL